MKGARYKYERYTQARKKIKCIMGALHTLQVTTRTAVSYINSTSSLVFGKSDLTLFTQEGRS